MKKCSHSFSLILAKSDLDNGQLLAKGGSCATTGSKVMTQTVNELKVRSKTGKVASVGFLVIKACFWSFVDKLISSLVKNRPKNYLR